MKTFQLMVKEANSFLVLVQATLSECEQQCYHHFPQQDYDDCSLRIDSIYWELENLMRRTCVYKELYL